jgi:hypothetical protein
MVLYSAIAVSTVIRGTIDVFDDTRGRMTLQATLELRKLAPSHSPVTSVRELWRRGSAENIRYESEKMLETPLTQNLLFGAFG